MGETYAWCTEHGFGPCPLLDEARKAYAAKMRKRPPPRGLILVSLCPSEPGHAAVYTRHAEPPAARDCLRRALRSERARRARGAGLVRVTSERLPGEPTCPIVVTTAYRTDCWCDRGVYPATAATAKEQQP